MHRILVVDDNELLCGVACDILRTEGFQAVAATGPLEALKALENEQFDLMVTDFRMPGMTGLDLARAVRARNPQFPIIVMSVFEAEESEHINLWLPKEYLFPGLIEKIRGCLSEKQVRELAK